MNIIKYLFNRGYRNMVRQEYSKSITDRFHEEQQQLEEIYKSVSNMNKSETATAISKQ